MAAFERVLSGIPEMDMTESCNTMCNIMMTRDEKMRLMVKKHFKPEDYFAVRNHMIGTGIIGGKACGMLLARAIIRNLSPEINEVLEPHDSFFVGSDVYYTYIVDNEFWNLRIRQRTEEEYFSLADEFALKLKQGSFSEELRTQLKHILEYYGQDPFLVRSSSVPEENIILESVDSSMGLSRSVPIDLIVYVDPKAYYEMPYSDKTRIARIIGKVNWTFREKGRHMMLIVPGRIGTSSHELGIPTSFADISEFEAVCEAEEKEAGYNPELSYGSHIFQDLVEADILYTAVFAGEKTLRFAPDKLGSFKNIVSDFLDNPSDGEIVKVFDMKGSEATLFYDLEKNHLLLEAFFP